MVVVDVETTGLNPFQCGIISIGAINFKYPERWFYGEGRPNQYVKLEKRAFEVNGFDIDRVADRDATYLPNTIEMVMNEFLDWLEVQKQETNTPMILGGHNVSFDKYFLEAEMERAKIDHHRFIFSHRIIDLHSVAHADYALTKGFMYQKDMGADYIQKKLGLPIEPSPHYALNGALFEAECFSRILFKKSMFDDFKDIPIIENPWE